MDHLIYKPYCLERLFPKVLVRKICDFLPNPVIMANRISNAFCYFKFSHPRMSYNLYQKILDTLPEVNRRVRFIRQSSSGFEAWCCPYKNNQAFSWGKRINRFTLRKQLLEKKIKAFYGTIDDLIYEDMMIDRSWM